MQNTGEVYGQNGAVSVLLTYRRSPWRATLHFLPGIDGA
jgi:hypothetical protein